MARSLYNVREKNTFEKDIDEVSKLLIKFIIVTSENKINGEYMK